MPVLPVWFDYARAFGIVRTRVWESGVEREDGLVQEFAVQRQTMSSKTIENG